MIGIQEHLLVAHEDHAITRLADKDGIILLAIMPSADREGQPAEGIDTNVTWLFILEKVAVDQTPVDEIRQYGRTQDIMLQIRENIEEAYLNGNPRFSRYRAGSTKIDPEYMSFGGFNGWSMSLVF